MGKKIDYSKLLEQYLEVGLKASAKIKVGPDGKINVTEAEKAAIANEGADILHRIMVAKARERLDEMEGDDVFSDEEYIDDLDDEIDGEEMDIGHEDPLLDDTGMIGESDELISDDEMSEIGADMADDVEDEPLYGDEAGGEEAADGEAEGDDFGSDMDDGDAESEEGSDDAEDEESSDDAESDEGSDDAGITDQQIDELLAKLSPAGDKPEGDAAPITESRRARRAPLRRRK